MSNKIFSAVKVEGGMELWYRGESMGVVRDGDTDSLERVTDLVTDKVLDRQIAKMKENVGMLAAGVQLATAISRASTPPKKKEPVRPALLKAMKQQPEPHYTSSR